MNRLGRAVLLPPVIAVSLFVAGCGVSSGDGAAPKDTSSNTSNPSDAGDDTTTTEAEPEDTTTTEPADRTEADQAVIDMTVQTYMDLGLNEEDATCLAEGILDSMNSGGDPTNTSDVMDIVNECDIPISELAKIGENAGGDMESGMKFGLETSLKNAGLTEEQASCVADAYVEEFGTDIAASQDASQMAPILEGCDVNPSDFSLGG
jgi:hypothetical protein